MQAIEAIEKVIRDEIIDCEAAVKSLVEVEVDLKRKYGTSYTNKSPEYWLGIAKLTTKVETYKEILEVIKSLRK